MQLKNCDQKCSVIIPVYNVEKYLDKCLKSVTSQTYANIEIILIDDGSVDCSGKICDNWAKNDNRIKVIHKENEGVAKARNYGLDVMTGDFVVFIDADDYVDLTMIQKLVKCCIKNDADITLCRMYCVYENGKTLKLNEIYFNECNSSNICYYYTLAGKKFSEDTIVTENIMGGASRALYKTSLIKNHRFEDSVLSEDLLFNLELVNESVKISKVDEYLYYYLQRKESLCHSFSKVSFDKQVKFTNRVLDVLNGKISDDAFMAYKFQLYLVLLNKLSLSKDKNMLKQFKNSSLFKRLCNKQNYKIKQNLTKNFKYKIANFCAYKKMFNFYRLCVNLMKKQ